MSISSHESPQETFDPDEMGLFGFDPNLERDRDAWTRTTPPHGIPLVVVDYSQDAFEFGGVKSSDQLVDNRGNL